MVELRLPSLYLHASEAVGSIFQADFTTSLSVTVWHIIKTHAAATASAAGSFLGGVGRVKPHPTAWAGVEPT